MNNNTAILQVEDDPNDVLLVRRAFRRSHPNIQLQVVTDGEQAVEYLSGQGIYANRAEHPLPALVLLDLKLPRKSGLEVLGWIRSQASLRRLRVVMFTSSKRTDDVDTAADLGANAYMVKAVDFNDFTTMIETLGKFWLELAETPALK
jgi:CheY-like chemotaxis protein